MKKDKKRDQKIPSKVKSLQNKKILLAEDYEVTQKIAAFYLKKIGCQIDFANNGKEAIDKFNKNNYDLILMDIQMPEMNGVDATKLIKKKINGKSIPILGLTANTFASDVKRYLKEGMDDVITKPFKKRKFLKKVTYWLLKNIV